MNLLRKFLRFIYYVFTGRWPELKDFFRHPKIERHELNPVLSPSLLNWESKGVLNPAAILIDGKVHLLYRAVGEDGVSRIGYASSSDGFNFDERLNYPVFSMPSPMQCLPGVVKRYDPVMYPSGGSWGGCEDPRMVDIDDTIYVTFNAFDGWDFMRIGAISIDKDDFVNKEWNWNYPLLISPDGQRHKNWTFFPEKFDGKFAILHSIIGDRDDEVRIEYTEDLKTFSKRIFISPDPHRAPDNNIEWHHRVRSAGSPPLRTESGWLVFYQAMQEGEPDRYKVGVMLLDLHNPEKVIARSKMPILSPDMYYENDWKPGIVYVCGALVKDGTLFIYYGGGDKYVCVASAPLDEFLYDLKHHNDKPHMYFRKVLFGKP
jgi:beta-1,2-mannobiose phosphorylase / 1,2-beta-oligomannan phosphorylase